MQMKKSKFQRDLYDYSHSKIYDWVKREHQSTIPKSILKKKNKRKRFFQKSRVSFSSSEQDSSEYNTDVSTEADGATSGSSVRTRTSTTKVPKNCTKNADERAEIIERMPTRQRR